MSLTRTQKTSIIVTTIIILVSIYGIFYYSHVQEQKNIRAPIKIGVIGPASGPRTAYGTYDAVKLALNTINDNGGINGRPVEIIYEDGKCDAKTAVSAMNKLVQVDQVKFVLGGQCTTESIAIAPIAEENKVIMLASLSSTPYLTHAGDYVFRVTAVSLQQASLIARVATETFNNSHMAIVYEQTDYTKPIAEELQKRFKEKNGTITVYESYLSGTTDFKTTILKIKESGADSVFIAASTPDSSYTFIKQARELGLNVKLYSNEGVITPTIIQKNPELYEGIILATPQFDMTRKETEEYALNYRAKYNASATIWNAESYDSAMILIDALRANEDNVEGVKEYLYSIQNYEGASGQISIDSNGDGVRDYKLMIIHEGRIEMYTE